MLKVVRSASVVAAAAVMMAGPLGAQNLVVGTVDNNGGNCYPFICFVGDGGTQWQQLYSSSAFGPSAVSISGFYLFATNPFFSTGNNFDGSTYSISLSTVSTTVAGLVSNGGPIAAGGNNQVTFSGVIGGPINAGTALYLSFAPFLYDPNVGNLLVDVSVTSPVGQGYATFLDVDFSCTQMARAFTNGNGSGADCSSMVTGFDTTPATTVPEPTSVALLAAGLLGIGAVARRKRRAAA